MDDIKNYVAHMFSQSDIFKQEKEVPDQSTLAPNERLKNEPRHENTLEKTH